MNKFHEEMDRAFSDPDNPTWLTDIPGPDQTMSPWSHSQGHPGVLTLSGIRDLMTHFGQAAEDELARLEEAGAVSADLPKFLRDILPLAPDPVWVKADLVPSKAFHTETYVLPANVGGVPQGNTGGATLVSQRGDRTRIILTNMGANPAFFSYTDDVSNVNTAGAMAWAQIPNGVVPGNPREIRAGGKVYLYSPLGTSVDVQEEYGYVYERGGFLTP